MVERVEERFDRLEDRLVDVERSVENQNQLLGELVAIHRRIAASEEQANAIRQAELDLARQRVALEDGRLRRRGELVREFVGPLGPYVAQAASIVVTLIAAYLAFRLGLPFPGAPS